MRSLSSFPKVCLALTCLSIASIVVALSPPGDRPSAALYEAGRQAEALEIYKWFIPVLELDIHPKLVQYIKLAESMTGLGTEHVRAPRLALEGEERQRVTNIIAKAIETRPSLPDYLSL